MIRRVFPSLAVVPLLGAGPTEDPPSGSAVLVEAGAEPRSIVRYRLRPGATSVVQTTSSLTFGGTMTLPDGRAMPLPLPPGGGARAVTTLTGTVGEPDVDGLLPVRFATTGAEAGAEPLAFSFLVSTAGVPVRLSVEGADPRAAAARQLASALVDRLPVFPEAPIGVGATWTSQDELQVAGLVLDVTSTWTLAGLRGDAADLELALAASLAGGSLSAPGLPPGIRPVVEQFDGRGGGTLHVDLTTLATTGDVGLHLEPRVAVALLPGGPPMRMALTLDQATEARRP